MKFMVKFIVLFIGIGIIVHILFNYTGLYGFHGTLYGLIDIYLFRTALTLGLAGGFSLPGFYNKKIGTTISNIIELIFGFYFGMLILTYIFNNLVR